MKRVLAILLVFFMASSVKGVITSSDTDDYSEEVNISSALGHSSADLSKWSNDLYLEPEHSYDLAQLVDFDEPADRTSIDIINDDIGDHSGFADHAPDGSLFDLAMLDEDKLEIYVFEGLADMASHWLTCGHDIQNICLP